MKKVAIVLVCMMCFCMLCACGKEEEVKDVETKDKFIGIWITWNDNHTFVADKYVESRYLKNESSVFEPIANDNGLYVFNYIIYDEAVSTGRETVASKELVVEDTLYEEDKISNQVYLYRTFESEEKIYFTRIYEKPDGTIYKKDDTKTEYFSQFKEEQTKQFMWDKYSIYLTFVSIDRLEYMEMSAYTKYDRLVSKETIRLEDLKEEYKVDSSVKYVAFEEFYTNSEGETYSKKNFDNLNTDDWVINYSCIFDVEGIGWKYTFRVSK